MNRPMTLEEKTQRVMREKNCSWHDARVELSQRSALVRRWKKAQRLGLPAPVPIARYAGPRLIVLRADESSAQDVRNIGEQARYLARGRALRSPE